LQKPIWTDTPSHWLTRAVRSFCSVRKF